MSSELHISRHPLVLHKLALLRSRTTESKLFREMVREIAQLLFYEATEDLRLADITVRTPLADCPGHEIAEKIGLVPILRAGLGMADAILELVPFASVWHIGVYRDHETLKPVTYYNKLPPRLNVDLAVVLDPMLATGGSAIACVDILKQWGAQRIKFLGLIGVPEGLRALRQAHADVAIYLAALDEKLNESAYIVPGLGDAGDRLFDT